MKRILLDTHAFLWWLADDPRLSTKCRDTIANPENDVFVSAASTWEISIKQSMGKLQAPDDLDSIVEDEGFSKLPISLFHGEQAGKLPNHHKDPFDRMIIAQAQAEGLTVVTCDEKFPPYGIRLLNPTK